MNRKQLRDFGYRYGVDIQVNALTDENMSMVGAEFVRLLKRAKWIADRNMERPTPKDTGPDWDIS